MKLNKLIFGVALTAFIVAPGAAFAQFPERAINIVVPFNAGGAADTVARLLAKEMAEELGQPVVVENRPGASGSVGAGAVAQARPDGYTVLLATAGHAGLGALYSDLQFDPIDDFRPIIGLISSDIVIAVNAKSDYDTLEELIDAARAEPGMLNCAGGGGGATLTNLAFEMFKAELDLEIEPISYGGSAPAMTALLAQEIHCNSDALPSVLPLIQAGEIRGLAVTGGERSTLLPDVPTVSEVAIPGFDATIWYGVLAPEGTPDAEAQVLADAFRNALETQSVEEGFAALAVAPTGTSGEEFGAFIRAETARWGAVIDDLGLATQ